MTETFYEVLGVSADASTADIEAAYRDRLKETHPDVSDAADAGEATQRLIEARDVLTDPEERTRYDRLGHEAYVSDSSDPTENAESDVASTARRAGYGSRESGSSSSSNASASTDNHTSRDRTGKRARRERRASERVAEDRRTRSADSPTAGERDTRSTGSADATDTTATSDRTESWSAGTSATSGFSNQSGGAAWSSSSTYTVRQTGTVTTGSLLEWPTGRELTLFATTFALYPVMLFSALLPAFPLWVNVTIGFCTLLVVGYLQSKPTIAIMVFGSWSLTTTVLLVTLDVSAFSLVGVLALSGTWLPFGFSLLTASVLRL